MTRAVGSFLDGDQTEAGFQGVHNVKRSKKISKEALEARRRQDAFKVKRYRQLSERILKDKDEQVYNDETFQLTTMMLDQNPEFYTVWNYRKDILVNHILKDLDENQRHKRLLQELQFVLMKQQRFPKCYWIWNHRKWCLKEDKLADWSMEMKLIGRFFQADSRNFHAWAYRRWVVQCISEDRDSAGQAKLDWEEWSFTTTMINHDISNYSAWHNRSALVIRLFENPPVANDSYAAAFHESKRAFLELEISMFQTAIYTDPDDSSVWIYMRWLFGDYFLDVLQVADIQKVYDMIEELAQLEKDDNGGNDNQWCLKSQLYLLKQMHRLGADQQQSFDRIRSRLEELDPMRIKRYQTYRLTSFR